MSSGSSLTSKLYDKIIKMLSKSHETIPVPDESFPYPDPAKKFRIHADLDPDQQHWQLHIIMKT
jgi:hypothetical protein